MDTEADIADTILDAEGLQTLSQEATSEATQREAIHRMLAESREDDNISELTPSEIQDALYTMARVCWSGNYSVFKRFEGLVLYDLLQYQHELVELEAKIISKYGDVSIEDLARLRETICEYRASECNANFRESLF